MKNGLHIAELQIPYLLYLVTFEALLLFIRQ